MDDEAKILLTGIRDALRQKGAHGIQGPYWSTYRKPQWLLAYDGIMPENAPRNSVYIKVDLKDAEVIVGGRLNYTSWSYDCSLYDTDCFDKIFDFLQQEISDTNKPTMSRIEKRTWLES